MAQSYPYYVLSSTEYAALQSYIIDTFGESVWNDLIPDFIPVGDMYYGSIKTMTEEEMSLMDEINMEFDFNVESHTDSQMAALMRP